MSDTSLADKPPKRSSVVHYVQLAALALSLYWVVNRRAESQMKWLDDFDTAVAQARAKEVPVLLDFWADWCGPCLALDDRVFSSKKVASVASEKYVAMRVDLSRPPNSSHVAVADHYGVETIPSVLVLDAASRKVIAMASHEDEASPEAFISFLKLHSQ